MTGSGLSCPRSTIDFHFLRPLNLLLSNPNPTSKNFDPQPQQITVNSHNNPPIQTPKLISIPSLIQTLISFLQFKKHPPQHPPPPPPPHPAGLTSFRYESGCAVPLFRPYVAQVPWHGGVRAFLSQLFPRYGHYCGPNWSSGKDGGSMLWDQRPIDWLDSCCYCHDIGYDTHDQARLLKADLAFLECLERPKMATKGGAHLALLYRSMCITGLRHILIPYRMQLLRMQSGPSFVDVVIGFIGGAGRGNAYRQNSG